VNFFFKNHPYFLQFNLETILFVRYFPFFFKCLIAVVELSLLQILHLLFGSRQTVPSFLFPFQILLLFFRISFFVLKVHLYLKQMIIQIFFFQNFFSLLLMKLKLMNQSLLILIVPFPFHHYLLWPRNQIFHFN
jgi:hypothetical protein